MSKYRHQMQVVVLLSLGLMLAGCAKKVAKVTPPAPQPTPTATLTASPESIQRGQTTTLTWSTQNATDIMIDGLGTVPASGSKTVSPDDSTTYDLTAKGPGGSADASARVTVTAPPAPTQAALSEEELFERNIKDVFFDYDKYDIRADQSPITEKDAKFLQEHPHLPITIEGHCDDRGSEEYNLALGASRADAVKKALITDGVDASRIKTVSYGKEKPFCNDENESCWSQNRRGHVVGQIKND
jgi:peptidoglycan-associated lipoprotein